MSDALPANVLALAMEFGQVKALVGLLSVKEKGKAKAKANNVKVNEWASFAQSQGQPSATNDWAHVLCLGWN